MFSGRDPYPDAPRARSPLRGSRQGILCLRWTSKDEWCQTRVEKIFDTHSLVLAVETDQRLVEDHVRPSHGTSRWRLSPGRAGSGQARRSLCGRTVRYAVCHGPSSLDGGTGATGLQPQRRMAEYLRGSGFCDPQQGRKFQLQPFQFQQRWWSRVRILRSFSSSWGIFIFVFVINHYCEH